MNCGVTEHDYKTFIDTSAGQDFTLVFWALIQHIWPMVPFGDGPKVPSSHIQQQLLTKPPPLEIQQGIYISV